MSTKYIRPLLHLEWNGDPEDGSTMTGYDVAGNKPASEPLSREKTLELLEFVYALVED